jgi:NAD(P)-dependent dehydrogenase (short-subunit alcohol dehydrogenase family)
MKTMPAEMVEEIKQHARMRRNGTPEDIGAAAVYLASAASSFVTGIELPVTGGPVDEGGIQFPDL